MDRAQKIKVALNRTEKIRAAMSRAQKIRAARNLVDRLMVIEGQLHEDLERFGAAGMFEGSVVAQMGGRFRRGLASLGLTPDEFEQEMKRIIGREERFFGAEAPPSFDQLVYVELS